jgi:hypothetical protein
MVSNNMSSTSTRSCVTPVLYWSPYYISEKIVRRSTRFALNVVHSFRSANTFSQNTKFALTMIIHQSSAYITCFVLLLICPSLIRGFFLTDTSGFFVSDLSYASVPPTTPLCSDSSDCYVRKQTRESTLFNVRLNKNVNTDPWPKAEQHNYEGSLKAFAVTAMFVSSQFLTRLGSISTKARTLIHRHRHHHGIRRQPTLSPPSTMRLTEATKNRNPLTSSLKLLKLRKRIRKNTRAFISTRLSLHTMNEKIHSVRSLKRRMIRTPPSWVPKFVGPQRLVASLPRINNQLPGRSDA